MAVPNFQAFFRPFLEAIADGQERSIKEMRHILARSMQISQEDLQLTVKSGQQTQFNNRVSWTKTYMTKASAIDNPGRGLIRINDRGRALLQKPGDLSSRDLDVFTEFSAFKRRVGSDVSEAVPVDSLLASTSPEEQLEALYTELHETLADEVLQQVMHLSPQQFEVLVVRLLVAMGYGGSVKDAGAALGRSGDNGVDGVVKQDPLGLDKVYIQAKQWTNNVGSQEVRNFSGSLTYHKATKGVLMTTAGFSSSATDTARQIGNIILIDGPELARLMIEYGVGVITRSTYLVRRVDSEFFEEI
ncbi:restriction endonuclease [Deinococcus sp.]|uniref:restriction endonuclease n=1 Tax=Deinococcus sp. TaxID=47478 RepID=UPI003C7AF42D